MLVLVADTDFIRGLAAGDKLLKNVDIQLVLVKDDQVVLTGHFHQLLESGHLVDGYLQFAPDLSQNIEEAIVEAIQGDG